MCFFIQKINLIDVQIYMWYRGFLHQNNLCKINEAGGRLNKKDGLTRYGDSHVKDKTS